jgi:hypothetical protein
MDGIVALLFTKGETFFEKRPKATAGPSTTFGAKSAPNSAQDDSAIVV